MHKYILLLFFILITHLAFAQTNPAENRGTIKISKFKPDSIYIKAVMSFQQFQEGNKKTAQPIIIPRKIVTEPFPNVAGYVIPFDYNQFCNSKIKIEKTYLGNKITDTINIQIKVLDNGKVYYKDLTPLMMLNGVPAYYDKKMNAYKLDDVHYKCLNIFKQIKRWEPAYTVVAVRDTFKKVTVLKPKKKYLSAEGILTIVFSAVPFED